VLQVGSSDREGRPHRRGVPLARRPAAHLRSSEFYTSSYCTTYSVQVTLIITSGSGQIWGVPGCPRAHRLPPCGACPRSSLECCPPETARTDHLLGDGQKNRAALPHPKPGARGCCSLARPQRLEEAVLSVSHDCMIPWVTVLEERGNVNSLMEFPMARGRLFFCLALFAPISSISSRQFSSIASGAAEGRRSAPSRDLRLRAAANAAPAHPRIGAAVCLDAPCAAPGWPSLPPAQLRPR
jgi:hypothetical protein